MTFQIPKWKHRSQGKKKLTGTNTLATKKKHKASSEENRAKALKTPLKDICQIGGIGRRIGTIRIK